MVGRHQCAYRVQWGRKMLSVRGGVHFVGCKMAKEGSRSGRFMWRLGIIKNKKKLMNKLTLLFYK